LDTIEISAYPNHDLDEHVPLSRQVSSDERSRHKYSTDLRDVDLDLDLAATNEFNNNSNRNENASSTGERPRSRHTRRSSYESTSGAQGETPLPPLTRRISSNNNPTNATSESTPLQRLRDLAINIPESIMNRFTSPPNQRRTLRNYTSSRARGESYDMLHQPPPQQHQPSQ
jgi:hypothetical protein